MLPTMPRLGICRIKQMTDYKIGDIISLETLDGKLHCHRITNINNYYVSTKGDNLEQQWYEVNVPVTNIHGLVKRVL